MITGKNTDVQYEGRVFHVQTEDKGRGNPVVESLVYSSGEIVTSRRIAHADILKGAPYSEAAIQKGMEAQHQVLIREVLNGRFDPEGPKPFGCNIITNRSLDEVVLDFLSEEIGVGQIRLEMVSHPVLVEGKAASLDLRVMAEVSDRPVAGARIEVKLITTKDRPQDLFSGTSDADGRVHAVFELPDLPGASGAILCQAVAAGNNAELKQLILKSEAGGVAPPVA